VLVTLWDQEGESYTFSTDAGVLYIRGLGNINTGRFEVGRNYEIGTRKFEVKEATIQDVARSIERMPQVILPKDSFFINYLLDPYSSYPILEIGAGNGGFSIITALSFKKKIISYELNPEIFKIFLKNIKRFECQSYITPKNEDASLASIEDFHRVMIDNPEPEKFYRDGFKGIMVAYVPTYLQAEKFSRFMLEKNFQVEIHEIVDIPMKISTMGLRPESSFLYHTAFIVSARS
jgi:tRNA(1-methyladenosine) methyltransferase and related methyltransferases